MYFIPSFHLWWHIFHFSNFAFSHLATPSSDSITDSPRYALHSRGPMFERKFVDHVKTYQRARRRRLDFTTDPIITDFVRASRAHIFSHYSLQHFMIWLYHYVTWTMLLQTLSYMVVSTLILSGYFLMIWSCMRDIWIFDVPSQIHFSFICSYI